MKKITDIASLLSIIRAYSPKNSTQLFFRGQQKKFSSVTPSIGRLDYIYNEEKLFKEYILRNPDEFITEKTTFEKLVKMQHYKLPTRLLDITSNPLVALFFAVEEDSKMDKKDGDFIIFQIPSAKIKYYDSDTVSVVSNIARRPVDSLHIGGLSPEVGEDHKIWRKRFNDSPQIQYLLHEIKEEKPYFKDVVEKEHLESIFCVKPLLKNRRIIKQDGAFLLFGIKDCKHNLADYKDFEPIEIPVKNKRYIRKELELLGISKDKLYPELDTTAEYLKGKLKWRLT